MPAKLTRIEDILRSEVPAGRGSSDANVTTSCPTCHTRQDLARAVVEHDAPDTKYLCVNMCQPIVIVSDAGTHELPGRGHRLGSYLVRNVSELVIDLGGEKMTLPASPVALESLSGRTRKYRI
jgi:hypothetical protein